MIHFLTLYGKRLYYKKILFHNRKQIKDLFSLLSDSQSKKVVKGIFSGYTALIRKPTYYFSRLCENDCCEYHFTDKKGYRVFGTKNPYFLDEFFDFGTSHSYFDGGAYTGDTISLFRKKTNNRYRCIYAFEPNTKKYEELTTAIKKYNGLIYTYNCGLDNKDGIAEFFEKDSASRIDPNGNTQIKVIDAGNFLSKLTDNFPTFIKLDIEGKEWDVLSSMADYIREYRPYLAISIYHHLDDIWRIPILIQSICPDYKVYIRHQSNYYTETICYAYANE